MSEDAVRQTRSQKRALERESAPLSGEPSEADRDSKRPKLDPTTEPPQPLTDQQLDGQGQTGLGSEEEQDQQDQVKSPVPLLLPPLTSEDKKNDPDESRQTVEPRSDRGTVCTTGAKGAEEDSKDWSHQVEPKAPVPLLAAGEVKATIKVEVQTREQPVDMSASKSTISKPPSPDDDVIILSDNDSPSPPLNGLSHLRELDIDLLMRSSPTEREQMIQRLKEELRLEEAKLVLLKKLRQSQIQRDTVTKPSGLSGSSAPPPLIRGTITSSKGSHQMVSGRTSGAVIPPPLVRGGQLSSKHGSQVIMPPLVRGAQQIQALRQQQQQQQLAASGGSGSGPPPLLLGPRTSAPAVQCQRGPVQPGLLRVGGGVNAMGSVSSLKSPSPGGVSVVGVNDSPASRQAAAKLALRKQLEKTLLEIPPPKPPAPDFNFLPSAANNEFIYLVGLEEVVHNLLDSLQRGKTGVAVSKLAVREPFVCTQCHTDFTCRWRQDKTKGGVVLCEDCMSSNQKKALKAEHTNRLKAAFVKALQQEQEIEQRIIQQTSSASSHQLKQAQARAPSLHHQSGRAAAVVHHHSIKSSQGPVSHGVSSVGVRGVAHSFSSSSQLQSAVAAAALVSRPGKHAHVSHRSVQSAKVSSSGTGGGRNIRGASGSSTASTAWKKQSNSNAGVTMAYVNPSLTGHKAAAGVDARQREYLLDMIPSRASISQTANTWK